MTPNNPGARNAETDHSPHTPRTYLARWGEGCKPYVVASDLPGVLSNIARFRDEVEKSRALQKRLAYARSWYAYRDEEGQWRFGPSKFVGYDRMTAEGYIDTAEDRDGRQTEAQLRQWFTAVDPEPRQIRMTYWWLHSSPPLKRFPHHI